jgi:hypothetical protein
LNMKKCILIFFIFTLFIIFFNQSVNAAYKDIRVGRYQNRVLDTGPTYLESKNSGYYYYDNFTQWNILLRNWGLAEAGWTDELGNYRPYKYAVSPYRKDMEEWERTYPIPDSLGITIHKYMRYTPPAIIVDGFHLEDPYPRDETEEVNPDRIPGTADAMLESWIQTDLGIVIHQRVLGWSQARHDDYLIYEWTFKNTGNRDLDEEIELPDQTIDSLYFGRSMNVPVGGGRGKGRPAWYSAYGERPGDSLRIIYAYDYWQLDIDYDDFGDAHTSPTAFSHLRNPDWFGEVTAHVDSSCNDRSDNPIQPQMTSYAHQRHRIYSEDSYDETGEYYDLFVHGHHIHPDYNTPYMEGTWPGTHHCLRMDEQGNASPWDFPWFKNTACAFWSYGPFEIPPGDSIRIVWASVMGSISPKTAWQVGKAWANGECEWEGDYKLSPVVDSNPELAPTDNDKAKDSWITTGRDSLFKNAMAAYWNAQHNYQVPIPPPAPSVEVFSMPDKILIKWGNESENAADLAGYRIYRAKGTYYYTEEGGQVIGDWEQIAEVGSGTRLYEDMDAERGVAYYYHVAAFDDGSHPEVPADSRGGVHGEPESLESGRFINYMTQPAYLTRPAGEDLSDIRVVPNPFHIKAGRLQYPGQPDKIMFLNLPPFCKIKIYNLSGDLIRTIEHTDGSGDEPWATPTGEYFQTTENNQIPVSGLYIARVETPDGRSRNVKFVIIR